MIQNTTDINNETQPNKQETSTNIQAGGTLKYYQEIIAVKTETNPAPDRNLEDLSTEYRTSEKILSSAKGVVLDIIDNRVKAKIDELIIFFPKQLFSDSELLQYGRQFIYQIAINEKGYRTQKFLVDNAIDDDADRNQLLEELRSI